MATPSIGPPPAAPPGAMAAAGGGRGNPHQNRALHVTGIRYFSWALKRFPCARGRLRRRNGVGVSMLTHGTRIMCLFSPMVDEALLGEINAPRYYYDGATSWGVGAVGGGRLHGLGLLQLSC